MAPEQHHSAELDGVPKPQGAIPAGGEEEVGPREEGDRGDAGEVKMRGTEASDLWLEDNERLCGDHDSLGLQVRIKLHHSYVKEILRIRDLAQSMYVRIYGHLPRDLVCKKSEGANILFKPELNSMYYERLHVHEFVNGLRLIHICRRGFHAVDYEVFLTKGK